MLFRSIVRAAIEAHLMHRHDVLVLQRGRGLGVPPQPLLQLRIFGGPCQEHLDCHAAVQGSSEPYFDRSFAGFQDDFVDLDRRGGDAPDDTAAVREAWKRTKELVTNPLEEYGILTAGNEWVANIDLGE